MNPASRHLKRKLEGINRYAPSYWKGFGGTKELYTQRYAEQQGLCAICSSPIRSRFEPYDPEREDFPIGCFDHCHDSTKPRGILCQPCNVALAYYETRIKQFHDKIKAYRRKYR